MDSLVDNIKGIVGIVRDGLITLILILLLFVPVTVNRSLIRAGFVEGDIGGFKWKATVESNVKNNNAQLTEAAATIDSLQKQLTTTQNALNDSENARKTLAAKVTETMPGSPAAQTATATATPPINQIILQNSHVLQNSVAGRVNLQERIKANDTLLATVKRAGQ